jgi:hypothetical protein
MSKTLKKILELLHIGREDPRENDFDIFSGNNPFLTNFSIFDEFSNFSFFTYFSIFDELFYF